MIRWGTERKVRKGKINVSAQAGRNDVVLEDVYAKNKQIVTDVREKV